MTGQFPDILPLFYSRFETELIDFEICTAAYSFPSWRSFKVGSLGFNSAVCVTWYVAWHQHLGTNMLWRQNYSVEFCARWWIIGSINPSNKFFLRTKQTNSLTWMILQLGCVQWKSLWPYTVVWLEIASFVDQTKIQVVRATRKQSLLRKGNFPKNDLWSSLRKSVLGKIWVDNCGGHSVCFVPRVAEIQNSFVLAENLWRTGEYWVTFLWALSTRNVLQRDEMNSLLWILCNFLLRS